MDADATLIRLTDLMQGFLLVLICAAFILYITLLPKAMDWLYCEPWWDRVRPALMVAEVALVVVGVTVGLLGGSFASETVGVSLAVVGLWAFLETAAEPVV